MFTGPQELIIKRLPQSFQTLLENSIYHISLIEYQAKFGMDYIDNINTTDVNYIGVGVDTWKRPFISLNLSWNDTLHNLKGNNVYTFFQRHANYPSWAMGSNGHDILQVYDTPFTYNTYNLKSHLEDALTSLVTKGNYQYHQTHISIDCS